MDFTALTLERVIYEIRYEMGYLYWDNSGKVLSELAHQYPGLQIRNVQLNNVQSDWWDEGLSFNFNNLKGDVTQDYPPDLKVFKEFCSAFTAALSKHIEVANFSRVGVRYVYVLPTATKDQAAEIVTHLPLTSVSPERIRPFGDKLADSKIMLRIEDDSKGYTIGVSSAERHVEVKAQRPLTVQTAKFLPNVVVFDVDCYTKKLVEVPALVVSDFITATSRNVSENLLTFVGV